jgi:hypothetical protein
MWRERRKTPGAAARRCVAALIVGTFGLAPGAVMASEDRVQTLAAEILVTRADLAQIAKPDLPPMHRAGFVKRIDGALGLIPWLLIVAGDVEGAADVAAWQEAWTGAEAEVAKLGQTLAELSQRHPLDMSGYDVGVTRAELAEARAIHDAYCAGCHDDMGIGDPEEELVGRDLFWMARDEETDQFLARLVNGVKGDETIGFANPLTEKQIAALWKLYTFH